MVTRKRAVPKNKPEHIILDKGCPLLKDICLTHLHLPTYSLTSFRQYGILLTTLKFMNCELTNDGLTEIGKMSHLISLTLYDIQTITDDGITNLVTSNHNLKYIDISWCNQLSSNSLISIASNCPNLELLTFYNKNKLTYECYMELFHKCTHLSNINNCYDIPVELEEVLKQRRKRSLNGSFNHQSFSPARNVDY